jgi:hypothetical protein
LIKNEYESIDIDFYSSIWEHLQKRFINYFILVDVLFFKFIRLEKFKEGILFKIQINMALLELTTSYKFQNYPIEHNMILISFITHKITNI